MSHRDSDTANLAERIAAAVKGTATSEEVSALIHEVEQARATADDEQAAARTRALDPLSQAEEARSALHTAELLRFESDRLSSALEGLQDSRRKAKEREKDARQSAEYEAAKAERDALVEELREVYPGIEQRLADLVARVAANNNVLERVNRSLPSGASGLISAEEVARPGRERFIGYHEYSMQRLTLQLRLPRFQVNPREPYAWPPAREFEA